MKQKIYEPVREFEQATSYCPLYLAWRIVDEARNYFRTEIPETYARKLARRAEAVFAKHALSSAQWRRGTGRGGASSTAPLSDSLPVGQGERERSIWWHRFQNREYILMSMRHWLAGVLARERPALFRALPEDFKIGLELPEYRGKARSPLRADGKANLARRARLVSPKSCEGGSDAPHHRFVHGCELLMV